MQLQNLKYFLAVIEEQSVSKAAKKNFMTQQTMSGYIRRLETEYGVKLFNREPRMHLTEAGRCLEKHAKEILRLQCMITNEIDDIAANSGGHLSIGITPVRARLLLPQLLPEFHHRHPKIELKVQIESFKNLEQELLDGYIDIMIATDRITLDCGAKYNLYQDPLCIIVPPNLVQLYDVESDKNITRLLNEAPFVQMIISSVKTASDKYFSGLNITPKVLLSLHDLETVLELSMRGMGYAFSFQQYAEKKARQLFQDNATSYPLILPVPVKPSEVVIATNKEPYQSHSVQLFINYAKSKYLDSYKL